MCLSYVNIVAQMNIQSSISDPWRRMFIHKHNLNRFGVTLLFCVSMNVLLSGVSKNEGFCNH